MYKNARDHFSIDTAVKKLYIKDPKGEIQRIKRILSCYLMLEQGYNLKDMRYDSFFAALLMEDRPKDGESVSFSMPSNIKVLSWNYDYQMELSIAPFFNNYTTGVIDEYLNAIPCYGREPDLDNFALIKLNGTAGSFSSDKGIVQKEVVFVNYKDEIRQPSDKYKDVMTPDFIKITSESERKLIKEVMNLYQRPLEDSKHSLTFAWERDPVSQETRRLAKELSKDTNILIVIGYSFPVFNREIDREIIGNMSKLEKIYFQIPEEHIDSVIERFRAIKDFASLEARAKENNKRFIERITNKDEFFIPYEFGVEPKELPDLSPTFLGKDRSSKHHY